MGPTRPVFAIAGGARARPVSIDHLIAIAGHNVPLQAIVIILGTFILEDAATVLSAMHARDGGISAPVALAALYTGIVLGDLGLYGLGWLSSRVGWVSSLVPARRARQGTDWLSGRVFQVVFVSRFIPGARLPTYTGCGFLGADLARFALAAIVATLIWTSLLFGVSLKVGDLLMHYVGVWRWAGAVGFALVVILLGRTAARLREVPR